MTTDVDPVLTVPTAPGEISQRDLAIAALAGLIFVVYALYEFWNNWAVDFSAYYYAGRFFHLGEFDQIYAGPPTIIGPQMPERWQEVVRADGFADERTYPFIYLPWVAWFMAPIAASVPPLVAMNVSLLVNIAATMASVVLTWRLFAATTRLSLGIWALLSLGVLVLSALSILALTLGQVQIPVFALTLLAFERYRSGKVVLAGVLLAAATMMKITPAAFAIIFLWDLNWRALGTFVTTTLVLCAVSVGVAGWQLHAEYFDVMRRLSAQLFMANIGASLEAFVYQLVDLVRGTAPVYVGVETSVVRPGWLDPVVKGAFVAGLAVIWTVTRRLPDEKRLPEQLFALAILLPLCTPLGWIHYYLLAAYMLPALFARRNTFNYVLFFGFLALTTLWIMYGMVTVNGPVMFQVMVYVPYFVALLIRVITHGIAAED